MEPPVCRCPHPSNGAELTHRGHEVVKVVALASRRGRCSCRGRRRWRRHGSRRCGWGGLGLQRGHVRCGGPPLDHGLLAHDAHGGGHHGGASACLGELLGGGRLRPRRDDCGLGSARHSLGVCGAMRRRPAKGGGRGRRRGRRARWQHVRRRIGRQGPRHAHGHGMGRRRPRRRPGRTAHPWTAVDQARCGRPRRHAHAHAHVHAHANAHPMGRWARWTAMRVRTPPRWHAGRRSRRQARWREARRRPRW